MNKLEAKALLQLHKDTHGNTLDINENIEAIVAAKENSSILFKSIKKLAEQDIMTTDNIRCLARGGKGTWEKYNDSHYSKGGFSAQQIFNLSIAQPLFMKNLIQSKCVNAPASLEPRKTYESPAAWAKELAASGVAHKDKEDIELAYNFVSCQDRMQQLYRTMGASQVHELHKAKLSSIDSTRELATMNGLYSMLAKIQPLTNPQLSEAGRIQLKASLEVLDKLSTEVNGLIKEQQKRVPQEQTPTLSSMPDSNSRFGRLIESVRSCFPIARGTYQSVPLEPTELDDLGSPPDDLGSPPDSRTKKNQ